MFGPRAGQRPQQWAKNIWASEDSEVETSCEVHIQHMSSNRSENAPRPVLSPVSFILDPNHGQLQLTVSLFWERIYCLMDCSVPDIVISVWDV